MANKSAVEASCTQKNNAAIWFLPDEYLPEITLLNDTCNDTMQLTKNNSAFLDSSPSTPRRAGSVNTCVSPQSSRLHVSTSLNTTSEIPIRDVHVANIPENKDAPMHWLDDRYFPEITLQDVTRGSEVSPGGEMSSLDVTRDIPSMVILRNNVTSSELGGKDMARPSTSDIIQKEDLSSTLDGSVTHTISSISEQSDKCAGENIPKAALQVTQDISPGSVLEDTQPSSEPNGQKLHTSTVDTLDTHPANATRDITSSSDASVQCAASQLSPSDVQCYTSAKLDSSLHHGEPLVTSNSVETNNESRNDDEDQPCKMPQPSPKNSTFTIAQESNLNTSANANTTSHVSCPQHKTLDLSSSSSKAQNDANNQSTSVSENTVETAPGINQKGSVSSCDVQNVIFDRHSLKKSADNAVLLEADDAAFGHQNNTFDKCPSKQNGTITVLESSSSGSLHSTLDKPYPCVFNATSSPIDNSSEAHPPADPSKHNGSTASSEPDNKMVDTHESVSETSPAVDVASADQCEMKDHSQPGVPVKDGLSSSLGHQTMDMVDVKTNTFNLDDTLDLTTDALITSTPMTNCKMFSWNMEREVGKSTGAQKKLYGDGPSKPNGQATSNIPSADLVRKTLTQATSKVLLPPLKAASQLLKYKPASALAGKLELNSGLPMTRQRTQSDALRNNAASSEPETTSGTSASYNLRTTSTGSKQPNPAFRKLQMSSIPSGIHRAVPGPRLPSARITMTASSRTDKVCETTGTNPATKMPQSRKHPLVRDELLSITKKKKMDDALHSGHCESAASSHDAAARAKSLKQPTTSQKGTAVQASTAETSTSRHRVRALKQPVTSLRAQLPKPQGHGCTRCVTLEQQLEMKSEENRRLKEGCTRCVMLEQQLEMKSEEIRRLKEGINCFFIILSILRMISVCITHSVSFYFLPRHTEVP
ncbi:serine-rich adhesin for platelets-like isoform X2 [Antennarius striatus]|uniref:serine-rich adhesin for platelets-like isoform X2 n=1 Tax=Antennarius striatus TaxID=241820 RepID=UPI0035B40F26